MKILIRLMSFQAEKKITSEEAAQSDAEDDNEMAPAEPPKKKFEPQIYFICLCYYSTTHAEMLTC